MRTEDISIQMKYIELHREHLTDSPFCKDIFHYTVMSQYHVTLTYTLQLYDDCSSQIGEYKAEGEMRSNQRITFTHLDELMCRLSAAGRHRFNQEAAKYEIRLYLPRADKLYVNGKLKAA